MAPRLITDRDFRKSIYAAMVDAADGVNVNATIERAEGMIERCARRRFSRTAYVERHQPIGDRIFLRERPILSVDQMQRRIDQRDVWETLDSLDFIVDADAGVLRMEHDAPAIAGYELQISYQAGFDPIPPEIQQAVLMQTALLLYNDQETTTPGDAKPPGIRYLKDDVEQIVDEFKKSIIA